MPQLRIHHLTRWQRFGALLVVYLSVLIFATWVAYGLRFEFAVPPAHQEHFWVIWPWVWAAKLIVLAFAGQFSSLLSFFSLPDLKRLGIAMGLVSTGLLAMWFADSSVHSMSRTVIILDGVLGLLGLCLCRLMFRLIRQGNATTDSKNGRVGIVGAGEVGAALARELQVHGNMVPVVFFDDERRKMGTRVHGIPVHGCIERCLDKDAPRFDEIIIAMPSASGRRVQEIVAFLTDKAIECRTVPAMSQLAAGELVTAIRPMEIGDVLGRDPVNLETQVNEDFFSGRTVLVTGAGGSIGSELCRQLIQMDLKCLVLVDQSEADLFQIQNECAPRGKCEPELVDVTSSRSVDRVMHRHRPDVVFHAAAYKHVAMLEPQASVAILNNVVGTHIMARAARNHQVERFTLISTDKAVNPTSVMGATKYLAEQVIEEHRRETNSTRYHTVRFGNVLGSSGSVIPIFQRQIESGGPVTVRDPEVTRFFMSIPEAAGLVLHSTTLPEEGVFILDMGDPVNITQLAEQMIHLSGRTLGDDVAVQFTGLLPGEKMHEELHFADEQLKPTAHLKIKCIESISDRYSSDLCGDLDSVSALDDAGALNWLRQKVPHFRPE